MKLTVPTLISFALLCLPFLAVLGFIISCHLVTYSPTRSLAMPFWKPTLKANATSA